MDHPPVFVITVGDVLGALASVIFLVVLGGIFAWAQVSDWWRSRRRARRDRRRLL